MKAEQIEKLLAGIMHNLIDSVTDSEVSEIYLDYKDNGYKVDVEIFGDIENLSKY